MVTLGCASLYLSKMLLMLLKYSPCQPCQIVMVTGSRAAVGCGAEVASGGVVGCGADVAVGGGVAVTPPQAANTMLAMTSRAIGTNRVFILFFLLCSEMRLRRLFLCRR